MDRARRSITLVVLLAFAASSAGADALILRDGSTVRGLVADHARWLSAGAMPDTATVMLNPAVAESAAVVRIPTAQVAQLLLEESGQQRLLDLASRRRATIVTPSPRASDVPRYRGNSVVAPESGVGAKTPQDITNMKIQGAVLIGLGAAIGIVGLAVKFGGPKATLTQNSIHVEDKSYDAVNYMMMGAGAVSLIGGIVTLQHASTLEARQRGEMAVLAPRVTLVSVRF